jgi:integrase
MASIENCSHYQVTVKNRTDLTKTFAHNAQNKAEAYRLSLSAQKLKPKLARLDNYYAIRDRSVSRPEQTLYARSKADAEHIKARLESEHQQSLFINYAQAYMTTLADLLIRYLREEAPRHKSFEVEAYKINAQLEDAGLERQDLAAIVVAHPNPHPKVASMRVRKPTGTCVREPSDAAKFIRKAFADIVPEDFTDYIDERCQDVAPATVDREIDIFSAVCNIAIDTWRIHVQKSPMHGVRRPRYYNERDRRLKTDEEQRLLRAAYEADRERSIGIRLELLMSQERSQANDAATVYRRKQVIKSARQRYKQEAENSYEHIALFETFVHFQLMTGARRGETLALTWAHVDLDTQTAYLPETKNGRARKLPIRSDLVTMLRQLPRTSELVFPIGVDGLRKAWSRMCEQAGLTGKYECLIHDLRHEAISRVAEAGSNTPGGFSLVDLQHFSGHRDIRMLLRYAHLCTQSLAKRLDAAFGSKSEAEVHHGRLRLKKGASLTLQEIANEANETPCASFLIHSAPPIRSNGTANVTGTVPENVIHVNFARNTA